MLRMRMPRNKLPFKGTDIVRALKAAIKLGLIPKNIYVDQSGCRIELAPDGEVPLAGDFAGKNPWDEPST